MINIIFYFLYKKVLGLAESERLAWWLVITTQDYYKGTLVMSDPLPGFRLGLGKTLTGVKILFCLLSLPINTILHARNSFQGGNNAEILHSIQTFNIQYCLYLPC